MPESVCELKQKLLRRQVHASWKHQALKHNLKVSPRVRGCIFSFLSKLITKCLFHSRLWVSVRDRRGSCPRHWPDGAHRLDTQPDNAKNTKAPKWDTSRWYKGTKQEGFQEGEDGLQYEEDGIYYASLTRPCMSVYVRARMESVAVKALKGAILKFPDKAKDSTNYPKNFISSSDNTHDGKYFWRQRDKTWLILH